MLSFILTLIFLPIIALLMIAASPFILLFGAIAIILITFLWVGQFVAIVFALIFIGGFIVKWVEKRNNRQ